MPCEGSQSKHSQAEIKSAQETCITKFTKDTNPVRSEDKNVRGFFVAGTKFIFSKHEDTADLDDLNMEEAPAIAAFGRWLLTKLPAEYTEPKLQGSLNKANKDLVKYEGVYSDQQLDFWAAAHVKTDKGKRVEVLHKRAHAAGAAETLAARQNPWWLARDEGPGTPRTETSGLIVKEHKGEWFAVATNTPQTKLGSRETLTALGALLADPRLHKTKALDLFEKCKDQTAFDGKLSIIYEEPASGNVVREECEWCQQEYAETAAALLQARPGLAKADKE